MNRVILDQSVRSKLGNLDSRLELCSESGETLGFFVPACDQQRLLYAWARGEFSDEEIESARQERGGFAIGEVLAALSAR